MTEGGDSYDNSYMAEGETLRLRSSMTEGGDS